MALHRRLFFLLLILLPVQLGFHFWPEWSYVLGRRIDYLSPTLYLTDIVIFLILLQFSIFNLKLLIKQRTFQALMLFAGLNIFFATSPWVSAYAWLKVFEFVGLGWYIVQNGYRISDVRLPLAIGVLYSSILAITQFIIQHSVGLWFVGERAFDIDTPGIARFDGFGKLLLRPYATFPHPNVLGGYLAVLLPFMIGQIRHMRLIGPISLIIGCIALVLSLSRSAWIAFLIGVLLMRRKFIVPALLVVVVVLLSVNIHEESVVVRRELNTAAITMWKQSPFVGIGLGNFVVELPKQSLNRQGNFLQPVHNISLLLLSEAGVVGLGVILFLLNRFMKHELGIKNNEKHNREKFIIHNSLFIILLLGLVDHYPLTLQQGQLLFALILALSMVQ